MLTAFVIVLALVSGGAITAAVTYGRTLASERRAAVRAETRYLALIEDLVNRTMYMAERPWKVPDEAVEPSGPPYGYDPDLVVFPEQSVISEEPP